MSAINESGLVSASTEKQALTIQTRLDKEAESIMAHPDQPKTQVPRNSKFPETYAAVLKAISQFGCELSIGLQKAGENMLCRYVYSAVKPKLFVTLIITPKDRIQISFHNGDDLRVPNDSLTPKYAIDLANQIRSATLNSKLVKFKQPELRNAKGG